ncbi:MAG: helix-turn-helix transcriptional regulator [Pseudomonadota bacterium]
MLSHDRIWAAIDQLAEKHDFTPSGLAKRAGLDSTTFNKSKRFAADGRARWPSTESLAKIMQATGASLQEFLDLVPDTVASSENAHPDNAAAQFGGFQEAGQPRLHDIPVVGMAQAGAGGFFDDAGFPAGQGWDQVQFPGLNTEGNIYALEITGDSMLPLYREGDTIIVSPNASVRKGDRVVVKTAGGEVMAKILKRKTAQTVELSSANDAHADLDFQIADIEWIARILWASQ